MSFFLTPADPATAQPPDPNAPPPDVLTAPIPSRSERRQAAAQVQDIRRDYGGLAARHERARVQEIIETLGPNFPVQDQTDPRQTPAEARYDHVFDAARAARAADPERFKDIPTSIEELDAQVIARRRAEFDDAQAILQRAPQGAWFPEFAGTVWSDMTNTDALLTLPAGAVGRASLGATFAIEGTLGVVLDAAGLDEEFETADDFGLDRPTTGDVVSGLALSGLTAGVLGSTPTAVARALEYRRARQNMGPTGDAGDDAPALERDARIDDAETDLDAGPRPAAPPRPRAPDAVRIDYRLQGKIRDKMPADWIEPALRRAVAPLGDDIGVTVTSGGQDARGVLGGKRTGSPRHDHGNAIDLVLTRNGRPVLPAQDKDLYMRFFQLAARDFPGLGHYGWGVHIGGGSRAAWGPDRTARTLDPDFARAIEAGRAGRAVPDPSTSTPTATAPTAQGFSGYAPTTRGYTASGQVVVGEDMRIDVDYQVVDLATLRQAAGDLQPRDRDRIASDAWVSDTAARLDPALLMPAPTADRGAPIVGPDSVIESGNGRVRAIARSYERHPDRADAYRRQIELTTGAPIPEGMAQPVLIARRKTDLDNVQRQRMVVDAQDSGVARMTATERAQVGQRALTADMLARFRPGTKLTAAENRDFVRSFSGAFPRSERNAFIDKSGALSIDGVRQINDSLFARAWDAPDILARYVETEPGEMRSLLDALSDAAPQFATLRAEIEAGAVRPEMDISGHVMDAARLIMTAREIAARDGTQAARIIDELLDEIDMLDGAVAPLTQALVRYMVPGGKQRPAGQIAAFLRRYADEARQAGRTGDALLDQPGPLDVLRAIDRDTFGDLTDPGPARAPAAPAPVRIDALPDDAYMLGAASPEAVAGADSLFARLSDATPSPRLDLQPIADAKPLERQLKDAQPFDSIDVLFEMAPAAQRFLVDLGQDIARRLDVKFSDPGLKARGTAEGKMVRKQYASPREMTDIARGGFLVDTAEKADAVVAALASKTDVMDEGWAVTPVGYFDRKVIVRDPQGVLAKVQIWSPRMLEAKKAKGHKLYEQARTSSDPDEIARLSEEMRALYSDALAAEDPSFRGLSGSDSVPNVRSNIDRNALSSATTRPVSSTSSASTSTQSPDGDSLATALDGESRIAGRPSQSANTGEVMGNTSDANIGGVNAVRNSEMDDMMRAAGDMSWTEADGTVVTLREVLDDLDADETAQAVIDACTLGGRSNG